jgi:predicted RNA binding protein YcfA (HicA-like mRNA interferase family)
VYRVDEVITMLGEDGWQFDSQEGDHRHYEHPVIKRKSNSPSREQRARKKDGE